MDHLGREGKGTQKPRVPTDDVIELRAWDKGGERIGVVGLSKGSDVIDGILQPLGSVCGPLGGVLMRR
jgi:hypothetical protein